MFASACGQAPIAEEHENSTEGPVSRQSVPLSLAALPEEPGQPLNKLFFAQFVNGKAVSRSVSDVPAAALNPSLAAQIVKPQAAPAQPPPRISEKLSADIDQLGIRGQDPTVRVVATFVEDLNLPRFPHLEPSEPRDSPKNAAAQARSDALVAAIEQARAPNYDARSQELANRYSAKEIERFWLINGMVLDMPLSQIRPLAARSDVQYVQYDQTDTPPPRIHSDIYDARREIGDLPWDSYGLDGGWLGLLDTGIRTSHVLLSNPNMFNRLRDCVNGTDSTCTIGSNLNTDDDCWNHGTAVASIMSANSNLTSFQVGTSQSTIDSWKVYPAGCGGYTQAAGVRAFSAAKNALDGVIVAEIQASEAYTDMTATAANAAFDGQSVVVAAAGNNGPNPSTVTSPGNATKVLAIGAIDVRDTTLQGYSGRGPTADGRFKPDLTAPTDTRAASTASNTALYNSAPYFNGTSGATPYAAAAIHRVWNLINQVSGVWPDPGQINAFAIAMGAQRLFDNNSGAGLLELPTLSSDAVWWVKGSVTNGTFTNWGINVPFTPISVDAAIWWPDPTGSHNDLDIYNLTRPDGSFADASSSGPGVWEKVQATMGLTAGVWALQVHGFQVTGTQIFYAVFIAHGP
jgi:hypothetical protein